MSGSRVTGAGTAFSMSGCQARTSWPPLSMRCGCPEPGSGTAPAGSGELATGGGETGRTSPVLRAVAPPSAHRHLALEPVLLGAHRPGAREAFERLQRDKVVP